MQTYDWIVIIVFTILFGWTIIINSKYTSLQNDYNQLKNNNEQIIDSLNRENFETKKIIKSLEDTINIINSELEKNQEKVEVIKKEEFVISSTFSKSATLLKKNLECTDL